MSARRIAWIAVAGLAIATVSSRARAQEDAADAPPLRLAMSGAFQPFSTTDDTGRLTGFDADVARALARRMGQDPVLVQIDWAGIQAGLQSGWGPAHLDSAIALFVGSWVWIVVLGFLALAVSAWVRWRPVAGFLLLLIFFGGGLVARIVELLFHSDWGYALDLHHDIRRVWTEPESRRVSDHLPLLAELEWLPGMPVA